MAQRVVVLDRAGICRVVCLRYSGILIHIDIIQIRHLRCRLRSIVTGPEIDHSAEEASDFCENIAEKAPLLLFEAGFLLFGLPSLVFLHDLNAGRFGAGAFCLDVMEGFREQFFGIRLPVRGSQLSRSEDI